MSIIKMSANKTIKSTELVKIINQFREVEGKPELRHDTFMDKIRNEIEILKSNKISLQNFMESTYINSRGKEYPCYELTKNGMLEMLNSESVLVRCKTVEYIDKLEEQIQNTPKTYIEHIEDTKAELSIIETVSNMLHLNDNSKLLLMTNSFENNGINTNLLPAYTDSKGILKSASELLKINNIGMSAQKFNKLMIEKGYLEKKSRKSTKTESKVKYFNSLVNTEYGENQSSIKNPNETQPLYYENKFTDLLKELGIQ